MEKKYDIVIWGLGKRSGVVLQSIRSDKCRLVGFIDKKKKTPVIFEGKEYAISDAEDIKKMSFDYILVTTAEIYEIKKQLQEKNVDEKKVIYFWQADLSNYTFLSVYPKLYYLSEIKRKEYEIQIKNALYEYGAYQGPQIRSSEELMKKIIEEKKSLCRFGDGEFEIILGRDRSKFQKGNEKFAKRLDEVLQSEREDVIVAIADNYGSLEKYTEEAARNIRHYLTPDVRKQHMQLLKQDRVYYDAYVSRCYLMYRDKTHADKIFALYKELFRDRDILIVEGTYTRNGYNNDLLDTAKSVKRILCPDYDCFCVYDRIQKAVKKVAEKTDLILLTLGSAATVLAYDLACDGYQSIDLGQLDNEYEWYLQKSITREAIPGKVVSEVNRDTHLDEVKTDSRYESQIVLNLTQRSFEAIS